MNISFKNPHRYHTLVQNSRLFLTTLSNSSRMKTKQRSAKSITNKMSPTLNRLFVPDKDCKV